MRRFDINKLPKDIRARIHDIQWAQDEDEFNGGAIGIVALNDEWLLDDEVSSVTAFESRADLINIVKHAKRKE